MEGLSAQMAMTKIEADSKIEEAWKVIESGKPGIYVWRVKNLKLEVVPKEDHGDFFDGDTFIVLNSYLSSGSLKHDIFLWIGAESTQDEYGVGSFKMVELDCFKLGDAALQHREVQGYESETFLKVFPSFTVHHGGYASGFKKVKKEQIPTLYHISGVKKSVRIISVPFCQDNIQSDDVYIIDLCGEVYMFKGKESNKDEQFFATQCWSQFKSKMPTSKFEIVDESSDGRPEELFSRIPSDSKMSTSKKIKEQMKPVPKSQYVLVKVSDESGTMKQTIVSKGNPKRSLLDTNDIFILNTKNKIFVWVGSKANPCEKRTAFISAERYVSSEKVAFCPVDVVKEGAESEEFLACF